MKIKLRTLASILIILIGVFLFYFIYTKIKSKNNKIFHDLTKIENSLNNHIYLQKDSFEIKNDSLLKIIYQNDKLTYEKVLNFQNEYNNIYNTIKNSQDTLIESYSKMNETTFYELDIDTKELQKNLDIVYLNSIKILEDDSIFLKFKEYNPITIQFLDENLKLSPLAGKVTFLNFLKSKYKNIETSILIDFVKKTN